MNAINRSMPHGAVGSSLGGEGRTVDRGGAARRGRRARRGFTLVELMIVMLIIAILAAIFLGALSQAEQSARVARTQSLVNKLNNMVMARWDTYRTIRLPIATDAKSIGGQAALFDAGTDVVRFRQNIARRRMFALREMVRLEMPDRYDDLTPSEFRQTVLVRPEDESAVRTAIWHAYQRRIKSAKAGRANTANMSDADFINRVAVTNESAECLYLIVTTNVDSSEVSSEHISPQDWRDTDQDGMPEFIDAWGKPIEFLRWAPGFESALQPLYRFPTKDDNDKRWKVFHQQQPRDPDDSTKIVSHWNIQIDKVIDYQASNVTTSGAARKLVERTVVVPQEDPFNPMRVGATPDKAQQGTTWTRSTRWRPGDAPPENGFALFPLIYSHGPDGVSGIQHCLRRNTDENGGFTYDSSPTDGYSDRTADVKYSDPYAVYKSPSGAKFYRGAPIGDGTDQDNIHSHRVGTN
jgi:prepilin-type N-terminal cleavage/methylation domain-containing protein